MRIDDDQIIYRDVKPKGQNNWLAWVAVIAIGVCLGGLMQDGFRMLAARAMLEHQMREFHRMQQDSNRQIQQKREAQARTEQTRRQEAARQQRLDSDLCRFWTEQDLNNPSDRSRAERAKTC